MADASFDIVSKIDRQEVANAVNTAAKEIGTRYDFKGVGASVELAGEVIKMTANSEDRCKAVLDVLQTWLIKRGVSLKHLDVPEAGPRLSGKEYKLDVPLKEGIDTYFKREVLPHVPDAWIDTTKTKVGYEIPLNRHFYRYEPPRELVVIEAEIKALEADIVRLLGEVTA